MQDFILTYPFNGFPFIPLKEEESGSDFHSMLNVELYGNYFKCLFNRKEMMNVYWLLNISSIEVNIEISLASTNTTKSTTKSFSLIPKYFMGCPIDFIESHERAKSYSYYMYYMEGKDLGGYYEDATSANLYMTSPLYINEDSYCIKMIGLYSFYFEYDYYILLIGYDQLSGTDRARYEFTLDFLGQQIPCGLFQFGTNRADELTMSANISMNSSYLE